MKTSTLLGILCLLPLFQLSAQSTIKGTIHDAEDQPLAYSNVLLLQASDSTLVRGSISQDDGQFILGRS